MGRLREWRRKVRAAAIVERTQGRFAGEQLGAILFRADDPVAALRRAADPGFATAEEAAAAWVLLNRLELHQRFLTDVRRALADHGRSAQ